MQTLQWTIEEEISEKTKTNHIESWAVAEVILPRLLLNYAAAANVDCNASSYDSVRLLLRLLCLE